MLLTEGFLGWVFLGSVNTFNSRHRTDRRVKGRLVAGWVYEVWADRWLISL
jgi:hypothetical protein